MVYGDFKDITRRTASDKILHDKEFNIAKNPKYDGYQRGLASMVTNFSIKGIPGSSIKNENISNKELAGELNKPIFRKFEKRKLHSTFIYDIWGYAIWDAIWDVADMQLISKFNKGIRFLLYINDIFSKYA